MLKEQVRDFFYEYIKINYDFDAHKDYDPVVKFLFSSMAQESLHKQVSELTRENIDFVGNDLMFRAVLVLKGAWPALQETLTEEEYELLRKNKDSEVLQRIIHFLDNDMREKTRQQLGPLVHIMEAIPADQFIEEVRKYEHFRKG